MDLNFALCLPCTCYCTCLPQLVLYLFSSYNSRETSRWRSSSRTRSATAGRGTSSPTGNRYFGATLIDRSLLHREIAAVSCADGAASIRDQPPLSHILVLFENPDYISMRREFVFSLSMCSLNVTSRCVCGFCGMIIHHIFATGWRAAMKCFWLGINRQAPSHWWKLSRT